MLIGSRYFDMVGIGLTLLELTNQQQLHTFRCIFFAMFSAETKAWCVIWCAEFQNPTRINKSFRRFYARNEAAPSIEHHSCRGVGSPAEQPKKTLQEVIIDSFKDQSMQSLGRQRMFKISLILILGNSMCEAQIKTVMKN